MRRLTVKKKIFILLSISSAFLLFILAAVYVGLFSTLSVRQLQDNLREEAEEIVTIYLNFDNQQIKYNQSDQGETLKTHLANNTDSAIILNNDSQVIGAFGVFDSLVQQNSDFLSRYNTQIINAKNTGTAVTFVDNLSVKDTEYQILLYPIKFNGQTEGIVIVGKKLDEAKNLQQLSLVVMTLALPMGIISSIISGAVISRVIFRPIDKLLESLDRTNANKLDHYIEFKGSPDDEFAKLAKNFNQMLDRVSEGMEKQKVFVSNASHELRTPLTRAVSSLDLAIIDISEGNADQAITETRQVKSDLKDLANILESLLSLASIEPEQLQNNEIISLFEVITKVSEQYSEMLQRKEINLLVDMPSQIKIKFSREQLFILCSNLLSNAIKYSANKSQIKFTFSAGVLSVTDQGVGINPGDKEKVMQRFFRSQSVRSRIKGAGLGLAIVRSICEVNNLSYSIDSKLDLGTTVRLSGFKLV